MKRCALFILLLTALAGTVACGLIGGSAPEGPAGLIPDSAREVVLVDVSQAALSRTDLPTDLESQVSRLENYGDVSRQATLSLASGQVTITGGDFDLEDIRKDLGESRYSNSLYRGYDLWLSSNGQEASALLADDGYLISGSADAVVDVLRDVSRGSGLLHNDDDGELNQTLDLAGEGLVTTVSSDCRLNIDDGCIAAAWAFSRGEERRTVIEGTAALLFRDQTSAAGAAPRIEQVINGGELLTLTEILREEATITLKVDIHREDFAKLQFPISLGE